jgi:hypothetical protein
MLLSPDAGGICDKLQRGQPGMHRASSQESGEGAVEIRLLKQECVVALVALDLHE